MGYPSVAKADIKCAIMDCNQQGFCLPGAFDGLSASPPGTEYNGAKTVGIRTIKESSAIVRRTLDIMNCCQPTFYSAENPEIGLLNEQAIMRGCV